MEHLRSSRPQETVVEPVETTVFEDGERSEVRNSRPCEAWERPKTYSRKEDFQL